MSDITPLKFMGQCKLTRWTPHHLTPRRQIHWMRQTPHRVRASSIKPSLPYLGPGSDRLLSCSLWRRRCSLAPDAICFSHSVDSSALTYTVRSPPSRSIAQNTYANLKCTLPSFPFAQLKVSVYGHTQTDRHTTRVLQCKCGARSGSPNDCIGYGWYKVGW